MIKKFDDLENAYIKLNQELPLDNLKNEDWVIMAVSEAGIYLASKIAYETNSKFDILFSEPIYAPNNSECKIAMVSETEEIIIHQELIDAFDIPLDFVYTQARLNYTNNILSYKQKYKNGEKLTSLKDKKALFVSEGVDTGLTMMSSVKTAINEGAKTISVATPLISLDIYNALNEITDDIYAVHKIQEFINVEFYYEDLAKLKYEFFKDKLKENVDEFY